MGLLGSSVFMLSSCAVSSRDVTQAGKQQPLSFEKKIHMTVGGQYLLFLPKNYGHGRKKWPLILFLHGAGERGTDINLVKVHGIPRIVESQPDFPFIAVSPQCPLDEWWSVSMLDALLDEIVDQYRVDEDHIYVTGLSMGGYGTWNLALAYPERFAAIAPICGGGKPALASKIRHLPIWVFHGGKDDVVPLAESQAMVDALKSYGSDVKLTVYPDAGHDSWTETYNNPELYKWLLSHKRRSGEYVGKKER